jgi:hypothetical protein
MMIKTRNGSAGRSLVRANRQLSPMSWGYYATDAGHPMITVSLEGSDGKTYTVLLDREDIRSIDAARARFPQV